MDNSPDLCLSFARVVMGWKDAYYDVQPVECIRTDRNDWRREYFDHQDIGSVILEVQYFCESYGLTMELHYSGAEQKYSARVKINRPNEPEAEFTVCSDACEALMTAALLAVGRMNERVKW